MLLLLGIGAPEANAAPEAGPGWAYKASFGEFSLFVYDTPRNPVAVDGSGNIFAADQNTSLISIFSPGPDGGTLLTGAAAVNQVRNLAIDPNDGTLYVDENFFGGSAITRYTSDGAPTPTYTVDPTFELPRGEGIAVDPTTGDLLVADPGAEGVRRYDTSGTLLETITTPSINPAWIVTLADGSFYVAPAEGPDVTHFSGSGTQLGTLSGVGSLHGLAYDASRSLVVVIVGDKLQAYSPAGALLAESPANGGSGTGLAMDSSGRLYEHAVGNLNFYTPGTVPGVEAPSVPSVDVHSAHVSAEVDPGAGPPEGSVAHFEVSADGGATWPISTPDEPVERTVTGGPDTIEADLSDLKGNTDYLVRLVASNSVITKRSDSTPFHTILGPPEVETGPANSVTETKAQLTGTIDTLGDQTTYRFEYGLTTSYGSKVPAGAEAIAGNEQGPRTFTRGISGLQPATTYHYRLVAKNAAGEAAGDDRTFTTPGAASVRTYEQVTPRNKMGGSVAPSATFQPAADGSAFAYQLGQLPSDAASATLNGRALSHRGTTGWLDWQLLDPPVKTIVGLTGTITHAISPDFEHTLVVSNRILTSVGPNGPYEDGGNIYIQDLGTGEYTFVGGAPGQGAYFAFSTLQQENLYMAGGPDFSWVVVNSGPSLLPGVAARAVYRWSSEGGLEVESRLPDGSIPVGPVRAPSYGESGAYRQASDDGSVVTFSLDGGEGGVYRRIGGQTTAISISQIPGDPDTVAGGRLDGASSDGRYAFFRSLDRLSSDAPAELNGGAYIYRFDAQSDNLEFVAIVNGMANGFVWGVGDNGQVAYYRNPDGSAGVWNHGVTNQVTPTDVQASSVWGTFSSPDGRYMVYTESGGSIYLYDAEAEEKVCVSCGVGDDIGELPVGARGLSNRPFEVVTNEGKVFFHTRNPMVAEDRNATSDVYMYQDGELTLISPGNGPYNARFADATADGSDVFFTTSQGIAAGDNDRNVDVYDARVGGGFPESGASTGECEGEGCKAPIGRPPDLETPKGGEATAAPFAISNLKPLTSADRKKLARGSKAHLRLTVSRAGTVTVSGKEVTGSSVTAKKAGAISVPFSLTKKALTELRGRGKLDVRLSVHFGDANPKVVHLTLKAAATRKGGRS
ncbi:MAG TPA: hypothetical protein VFN92_09975 [Solirubrobacterales bacterium]|nr:hypothetical protein [Solirubrobacterales bacterium]